MQMTLQLTDQEQLKKTWAFAIKESMPGRGVNRKRLKNFSNYVITSCSKEAKILGVRAGMRYDEAKQLIPDMKILLI